MQGSPIAFKNWRVFAFGRVAYGAMQWLFNLRGRTVASLIDKVCSPDLFRRRASASGAGVTAVVDPLKERHGGDADVEDKMNDDELVEQPARPPVPELADDAWFDEVLLFFDHLDPVIEVLDPAAADGHV